MTSSRKRSDRGTWRVCVQCWKPCLNPATIIATYPSTDPRWISIRVAPTPSVRSWLRLLPYSMSASPRQSPIVKTC